MLPIQYGSYQFMPQNAFNSYLYQYNAQMNQFSFNQPFLFNVQPAYPQFMVNTMPQFQSLNIPLAPKEPRSIFLKQEDELTKVDPCDEQIQNRIEKLQDILKSQKQVIEELCDKNKDVKNKEYEEVEQQDSQAENLRQLEIRKKIQKNEAKNIPKNIIKAIVKFIQKKNNGNVFREEINDEQWDEFNKELENKKKKVFSINQLKNSWYDGSFSRPEFSKMFRFFRYIFKHVYLYSQQFLKRHFVNYMYNSKIQSTRIHLKSRHKLLKAIYRNK